MNLYWGVEATLAERVTHTDEMFQQVERYLLDNNLAKRGDKVIIVSGMPPGVPGSTNDVRVHRVGEAEDQSIPAYRGRHTRD